MRAQTGISYHMHTTEIPILTSGSKYYMYAIKIKILKFCLQLVASQLGQ